jgi:hypothetical protein
MIDIQRVDEDDFELNPITVWHPPAEAPEDMVLCTAQATATNEPALVSILSIDEPSNSLRAKIRP